MQPFEIISHTADIKIHVYGTSLKELFIHAVKGMFFCAGPHTLDHASITPRIITLNAPSQDLLLIDFLSECLYLSDIHNETYEHLDIKEISDTHIQAILQGIPIDRFEIEIKAVTYHDFAITKVDNILQATIVFDI
jgi:SHS2 domain-containing protein